MWKFDQIMHVVDQLFDALTAGTRRIIYVTDSPPISKRITRERHLHSCAAEEAGSKLRHGRYLAVVYGLFEPG